MYSTVKTVCQARLPHWVRHVPFLVLPSGAEEGRLLRDRFQRSALAEALPAPSIIVAVPTVDPAPRVTAAKKSPVRCGFVFGCAARVTQKPQMDLLLERFFGPSQLSGPNHVGPRSRLSPGISETPAEHAHRAGSADGTDIKLRHSILCLPPAKHEDGLWRGASSEEPQHWLTHCGYVRPSKSPLPAILDRVPLRPQFAIGTGHRQKRHACLYGRHRRLRVVRTPRRSQRRILRTGPYPGQWAAHHKGRPGRSHRSGRQSYASLSQSRQSSPARLIALGGPWRSALNTFDARTTVSTQTAFPAHP